MIFVIVNKNNVNGVNSIKVSRFYNEGIFIIDKEMLYSKIKNCNFTSKDFLLYISDNEYANTVQLDKLYKNLSSYNIDIIVLPELFTSLENIYIINNTKQDYQDKILFNKSHSFLYSFKLLKTELSHSNIDNLINKLSNPFFINHNSYKNIIVNENYDFILINSINLKDLDMLNNELNLNKKSECSYNNLLKIINEGYFGMEQDI